MPSLEELQGEARRSSEVYEELKRKNGTCHRSFYRQVIMREVPLGDPNVQPSPILTPHGPVAVERPVQIVPVVDFGWCPCAREMCVMWDAKALDGKGRCLEVSAAIRAASR
jgi:hypothetical protein